MAEETIVQEQVAPSPFGTEAWTEQPPTVPEETVVPPTSEATPPNTAQPEPPATPTAQPEVVNEWYKSFGWETEAAAKEEIPRLKEQKPQEQTFANDVSKTVHELLREGKIDDVIEIYQTQKKLNSLTSLDVTKENAVDIIKLEMQLKNKRLSQDDVDFQYKELYVAPKEPVQRSTETDEDFTERHEEWKEKSVNVERRLIVAAKMAIPELEKLKSEIVYPEITKPQNPQAANQPTEAELKQARDNFLQALNINFSKVEGFTTKVKDESVEIPIQFKIPEEDKVAIKGRLEQGLSIDEYMDKRWFDEKGNPKVDQIISDIYELENRDKVHSGIANDAASKRLAEYIRASKNPSIATPNSQTTFQPEQNGNAKVSPFAEGAWSDKPPIFQN